MENLTMKQLIIKLSELLNLPKSNNIITNLLKIENSLTETKELTNKKETLSIPEKINYAKVPAIEKFLAKTLTSIIECSDPQFAFEFYESYSNLNLIKDYKEELSIIHKINILFNSVKLKPKKLDIEKEMANINKYAIFENQEYLAKLNKTINFIEETNSHITKIGNYSNEEESFITFINQQTLFNELKNRLINTLGVIKNQDNLIPSYLEFLETENLLVVDNDMFSERDISKRLRYIEEITNFKISTPEETKQYILDNNPEITEKEINEELQKLRIANQKSTNYLKTVVTNLTNILGENDKHFLKNIFEIIDYLEETNELSLNISKNQSLDKNNLEKIKLLENKLSDILKFIINTPNPKINLALTYKRGQLLIKNDMKEEKNINRRIEILKSQIQCDKDSLLLYPNDYSENLILLIAGTTSDKEIPGIINLIEMKCFIDQTKYLIMDQNSSEEGKESNKYDLILLENKFIELLNNLVLSPNKELDLVELSKRKIINVTKTQKSSNSIHNRLNMLTKKLYIDLELSEYEDVTDIVNTITHDNRISSDQKKELLRFVKTRIVNPQPENQMKDKYIKNKLNMHKISRKLSNIENHQTGETSMAKILRKGTSII